MEGQTEAGGTPARPRHCERPGRADGLESGDVFLHAPGSPWLPTHALRGKSGALRRAGSRRAPPFGLEAGDGCRTTWPGRLPLPPWRSPRPVARPARRAGAARRAGTWPYGPNRAASSPSFRRRRRSSSSARGPSSPRHRRRYPPIAGGRARPRPRSRDPLRRGNEPGKPGEAAAPRRTDACPST